MGVLVCRIITGGFEMKILTLFILLFLILPVSAAISVSPISKGQTYIEWNWSGTVANISIDGLLVCNTDISGGRFVLSGLEPNETHSIKVQSTTDSGTNTTNTLPSLADTTLQIFFSYIFFIAAIICILIGVRIPFVAFIGAGLCIIGVVNTITVSFWSGFVFMCVFCAAIFIAFDKGD